MAPEIDEETTEFLTRLGGGVVSSLEDAVLEWYRSTHIEAQTSFPFNRPHPSLPTWNEILVGVLAIPPFVAGMLIEDDARSKGDVKTQEAAKYVRHFGEGSIYYAAPMLTATTIVQVTPAPTAARSQSSPSPAEKKAGGIVYKL